MIGFDNGAHRDRSLNDISVPEIHSDLTAGLDSTAARKLEVNAGISYQGPVKVGQFELDDTVGVQMLHLPNPHLRPNSDVIRPWFNGSAQTGREPFMWIVDFLERSQDDAAFFEAPFGHVRKNVKPERDKNNRARRREFWWIHGEVNNAWRAAVAGHFRFLASCQTSKYRLFSWYGCEYLPAQTLIVFARSDDYFFGVLHSRIHELWGLRMGTRLETRPRYTPTTCFETFPFPEPTPAQRDAIAAAAKELDDLRNNWLNPPEWTKTEVLEFPGSVDGPWKRYVDGANAKGIGTVRYPRLVAKDADSAAKLKKRTLTNLYNERPAWLANAHKRLDEAVFAAYGWPADLSDDDLLAKLLALNLERAAKSNHSNRSSATGAASRRPKC
jgi:hypothetical protein